MYYYIIVGNNFKELLLIYIFKEINIFKKVLDIYIYIYTGIVINLTKT